MATVIPPWTTVLDELDEDTARLIGELQLEDQNTVESDAGSDAALARQVNEDEIKQDSAIRSAVREENELAEADEGIGSAENGVDDEAVEVQILEDHIPEETHPEEMLPTPPLAERPGLGGEEGLHETAPPEVPNQQIMCSACVEEKHEATSYRSTCEDGHVHCAGCMERWFRDAMGNPELFPLKCCGHKVDFDSVKQLLSDQLGQQFEEKKKELEDREALYCHVKLCSASIGPELRGSKNGTCPLCQKETCLPCEEVGHEHDCVLQQGAPQVDNLGREMGWQKCFLCPRWIERTQGCAHIWCPCGAEFCYVCGVTWKNCPCKIFDMQELVPRAEGIARRQGVHINEVVQHLVGDPQGRNDTWEKVDGAEFICDGCDTQMGIFQCLHCNVRFCHRCRFNRGHAWMYRDEVARELRQARENREVGEGGQGDEGDEGLGDWDARRVVAGAHW